MKSPGLSFPIALLWLSFLPGLPAAPVFEPLTAFRRGPNFPSGKLVRHTDGDYYGVSVIGGASGDGTIYRITAGGAETDLVHFSGITGPAKGSQPAGGLVLGGDGLFWGVTAGGGAGNLGTVFKFDLTTRVVTTVVEFTGIGGAAPGSRPLAALAKDADGQFWGTTVEGGTGNFGTLFKLNPVTGVLTTMVHFTGLEGNARGNRPEAGLVRDNQGWWWGTTRWGGISGFGNGNGTVFKYHPGTSTFTSVASFTGSTGAVKGSNPTTALSLQTDGMLWGTTAGGGNGLYGTVFKIHPTTGVFTAVYESTASVSEPMGPLWPDSSGFVWGVATRGGSGTSGLGSVFKINKATGVRTTVATFTGSGTAPGRYPMCELVPDGAGSLIGSTVQGGARNYGTIFKVNVASGALTTIFECGSVAAGLPVGAVVSSGLLDDGQGSFWGVTQAHGAADFGTVFKFDPVSGALSTVVEFSGSTGSFQGGRPLAGLSRDETGLLWGTASAAGTGGYGTVFRINPAVPTYGAVVHFNGPAGANSKGGFPEGVLTKDAAGFYWGTTAQGGAPNRGIIFKVNAATSAVTTVKEFNDSTVPGRQPRAGLTAEGADFFWGTTSSGGTGGKGTVFKINRTTGALTTVVHFSGIAGASRGREPRALLVSSNDGFLWGSTAYGGTSDLGTIFRIHTGTGVLTTVAEFTGTSGAVPGSEPWGALLRSAGGGWWGTTYKGGSHDMGTIFHLSEAGECKTYFQFTGTVGAVPGQNPTGGAFLRHSDGSLYGTASQGGLRPDGSIAGGGQIFRVKLPALSLHAGIATDPEIIDGQAQAVDFGRHVQGGTPPGARPLTLINRGGAPLIVGTVTLPPGYTAAGMPALPLTLNAGAAASFQISLTGTVPQIYAGTVLIGSDDVEHAAFDFPVTGEVYIPNPAATTTAAPVLNPQTGVYEQTVRVTNATNATVPAYHLIIRGVPAGVELNNASSQRGDGTWVIYVGQAMNPQSVQDILGEYFFPGGALPEFTPQLSTEVLVAPPALPGPGDAAAYRIDLVKSVPGEVLIEFHTAPGRRYQVEYSSDGTNWLASLPSIRAVGNRTRWADRGLPRTDSSPSSKSRRFYRVIEAAQP